MKKFLISVFIAVALITFCSSFATADSKYYTIWAGQYTDAGWVHIYTDGTTNELKIEFFAAYGWELAEAHAAVHTLKCLIPQTGNACAGKPGNPKIGHFAYKADFDPPVTPPPPYTFTIPISEIDSGAVIGQTVYVAIHVVVVQREDDGYGNLVVVREETGWVGACSGGWNPRENPISSPFEMLGKSGWSMCFQFTL